MLAADLIAQQMNLDKQLLPKQSIYLDHLHVLVLPNFLLLLGSLGNDAVTCNNTDGLTRHIGCQRPQDWPFRRLSSLQKVKALLQIAISLFESTRLFYTKAEQQCITETAPFARTRNAVNRSSRVFGQ